MNRKVVNLVRRDPTPSPVTDRDKLVLNKVPVLPEFSLVFILLGLHPGVTTALNSPAPAPLT